MNSPFVIGEVLGQPTKHSEDPEAIKRYENQAVDIEVTHIHDNGGLEVKVVRLGDFYSSNRIRQGFVLGEMVSLERKSNEPWWIITTPQGRPWHLLKLQPDGTKTFEHYR